MYKPPGCFSLNELKTLPQIRLGIQGYGGTGKTWAALTFPNPVVANLDRGLGAHLGRGDVIEVPFYDPAFCRSQMANPAMPYFPHYLKDVLYRWLEKEAPKLSPEQTLVWDGGTGMQNAFHKWYSKNLVIVNGEENMFAQWDLKKKFYADVIEMLKTLPCHVVMLFHEAEKKDKDGEYRGKIRPLLTGSFGDELMSHFSDWFRQHAMDKPADVSKMSPAELNKYGMTPTEFKAFMDTTPRNTYYVWQTESDSAFDGKCSSLVNYPRFVPANFSIFEKYRRKIST